MAEFFHMGGYAFYVWMSFGISALVLLANFIQPLLQHRQALRDAEDFYSDAP
ncbi:hypothetical protein THMIRHAS_20540 [Thiosulfatimonas sediminis]|uniref:Heme exporter protein D n=1 Tax=Thiosulfatimonas sediminis TaxID=2675054 RepID=A0A6F8PX29_9GAMM|nr:heme exporter protein CcmD [Thiosulfatimonas sediminis]BBP46681.1 hypothetical protein THMIRHAS_20540 [Thiosulfatimonas sediminis]